jgi:hypothetical protein
MMTGGMIGSGLCDGGCKDGCDGDGEKKVRFVSALESRRQRSFVMTSVVFHHPPG